jgi:nitroreductase
VTFDLKQIDHLLSTTRAVRRRLDLETPVPDEVLLRCIDLAEQAPTGGNQSNRRWLVIRDTELKRRIADLYREVGLPFLRALADRDAPPDHPDRVFSSAVYLAENLERVPALVIVTIHGIHDGSGRPGLYDSVLQSAWSFCLAARSRGLGTAWTTLHLNRAQDVADLLGIPDDFTQVVLFPVGWTTGDDFRPVARRPAHEITYFDGWALTRNSVGAGPEPESSSRPGVTVEERIMRPPDQLWDLLVTPADAERPGVEWVSPPPTTAESPGVLRWDPPYRLAWCESSVPGQGREWALTFEPILMPGDGPQDGTLVVCSVRLDPGRSESDTRAEQLRLRAQMQRLLQTMGGAAS